MAGAREPDRLAPHPEIRCRVRLLIRTARHDGGVTADEVRLLERTLRSFAFDSALGAGHFVQEERPEAVVASAGQLRVTAALAGLCPRPPRVWSALRARAQSRGCAEESGRPRSTAR
jgi:pimeloyl-ACP methyl ester carboxylesterase